jgi:hypothetical protein
VENRAEGIQAEEGNGRRGNKVKKLLLILSKCKDCPYLREYFGGMSNYTNKCTKLYKWQKVRDINTIPEWCPLPDETGGGT